MKATVWISEIGVVQSIEIASNNDEVKIVHKRVTAMETKFETDEVGKSADVCFASRLKVRTPYGTHTYEKVKFAILKQGTQQ